LDELKQIDPREAGEVAYLLANGSGKQRANQHGGARDRASWRLLFLSSGEISLADHMRAAGKKAQAGQETRLADIPSDTGKYGAFEDLHGHEGGEAFARALTQAGHTYHGTAGRAFLRQLVALDPAKVAKQVGTLRDDFMKECVPPDASGQVQRVAMRFALVAAGGNLATSMGITGWPEGEAINAAVRCFKDWLAAWGGVGNKEVEVALSQVRHFFELHGESRFTPWDSTCRSCDGEGVKPGDDGREFTCLTCKGKGKLNPQNIRTGNRAGFCRENTQSETEFYVFPEVFKQEMCAGMDPRFVARVLVERGLIYPDKEDGKKPVTSHKPPGMKTIRLYHFAASILDSEG
jgi:uncharacterized protein (DUF927 family)